MKNVFHKIFQSFVLFLLLLFSTSKLYSQLVINEFLASNSALNEDPDFQNNSDWLELYNAGSTAINLKGYYITDNLNNPAKWKVTIDTVIAPGSYVVIWTDSKDSALHTSYNLSKDGEEIGVFSPIGTIVDTIRYKTQSTDISVGRSPDGGNQWYYFNKPTPGSSNNTQTFSDIVYSTPQFSKSGGLYDSPLSVEISSYMGGTIRYTLDGSEPEEDDMEFSIPINISSTTIIRARIFKPNQIPGPIVTHSYFLNEHFQSGSLPVVSIASNPENFWDPVIGIYAQTFKPEWEVPVNIELFENDGSDRAGFNERAGIKINGLHSWQLPQKMLGIYFRKRYGSGNLDYPLIYDKERKSYKTFALRASGSDWSYTLFRDGMTQNSVALNMKIDRIGFRPCVVYINGQYMGIHNIREKVDEDFIAKNHNLENGTFDMVENEDYAEAGSLNEYNRLIALYSKDLSIQTNFDALAEVMDIENFTELLCTEIACRNSSINHNVMAWKPKEGGKWKWIINDLDRGYFSPTTDLISYYTGQTVWPFSRLMMNQGYKAYFGKKLADHLYTTFNPIRIKKLVDKHQQLIEDEMSEHIERWLGTTSSYGNAMPSLDYWYDEVCKLKTFADARPSVLLNNLKSYGFSSSAQLNLKVSPAEAGSILFNELKIPESEWAGLYPMDIPIDLVAQEKPGYKFKGWTNSVKSAKTIIPKNSLWKYFDAGISPGNNWQDTTFNDNSWSEGQAEFGYGDGDEQTAISYGGNALNKYITSYFRKSINLVKSDLVGKSYTLNLLYDDGAVIYINGFEALRVNIGCSSVNNQTLAAVEMGSPYESQFSSFSIDASLFKEGRNTIAVEIHQYTVTSTDISFNLELICIEPDETTLVSKNKNYQITLTDDLNITAVYESDGRCIIPGVISHDITLNKECSPYLVQGDISILPGAVVTIDPGVEVWLAENSNIFVNGRIDAKGNSSERIIFRLNPAYNDKSWGAICFQNTPDTSHFSYVTIEDASKGPVPVRDVAAISAYHANLKLDNLIIEDVDYNPIAGRYSDIALTNSSLHSEVTGDLINVKYGKAKIENCTFRGNDQPDTDGIDYDDVENGIIKNCIIHGLFGFNSDAIDIGEKAKNIIIDSVLIYDITDKGVSVGQQSTAMVSHSSFVNCNLGLGLKDSCMVTVNHCTFYGNYIAVSCYEKNAGSAGGNVLVKNSILSNSYNKSYYADNLSSMKLTYCLSDNDSLPSGNANIFGNPDFEDPNKMNFNLLTGSPSINTSDKTAGYLNMGTYYQNFLVPPHLMIINIFYNPLNLADKSEYLTILNPSDDVQDISGYKLTKGISFEFPQGTILYPGEYVILVKDLLYTAWNNYPGKIFQWTEGTLSNQGEKVQLTDKYGVILDQVEYKSELPWPPASFNLGDVLVLKNISLDNHFAESWTTLPYTDIDDHKTKITPESFTLYPNPSSGEFTVIIEGNEISGNLEIYDLSGRLITSIVNNNEKILKINLSYLESGSYLIRFGKDVRKFVLMKGY